MCGIIGLARARCAMQDLIMKLDSSVPATLIEGEYMRLSPYKPHRTRYAVLVFFRFPTTALMNKTDWANARRILL